MARPLALIPHRCVPGATTATTATTATCRPPPRASDQRPAFSSRLLRCQDLFVEVGDTIDGITRDDQGGYAFGGLCQMVAMTKP